MNLHKIHSLIGIILFCMFYVYVFQYYARQAYFLRINFLQIIYKNSINKFGIISYSIFLLFYFYILLYLKKIVRIIERYPYYDKIYSSNEEAIEIHNEIRKSENSTWVCLNVKVITMQESS